MDCLYLGSVGAAYTIQTLRSLDIRYILTVCENLPPKFPNEFIYKIIPVTDEPTTKISHYFKESLDFIRNSVVSKNNVLVHCFAGVSRSASVVIAYLMKYHKMEYNSALNYVKSKRPWVNPNYGFQGQLRRYNIFLKNQKLKESSF